jgi:hypothetical protein
VLKIKSAIPVILTLHAANPKFISGIPIVPVSKFSLFLAELDGNIESLRVITAERD